MNPILFQAVLPFFLSAIIVVIIMFIAEKYGTKTGGILGTLPSTIVIAFIFIALNQDVEFASKSAAVVPAELGINILFLFFFAIIAHKSTSLAFMFSLSIWTVCSALLFIYDLSNIYLSIAIYLTTLFSAFFILEKIRKIPSTDKAIIRYTPMKIALRGVLAGIVISIAVLMSNIHPVLSGIFSVFPAILTSTMLISVREHGSEFAAGMAKSMIIGISSVTIYATVIHFLYPVFGIIIGSIGAYILSAIVTLFIFILRNKIR